MRWYIRSVYSIRASRQRNSSSQAGQSKAQLAGISLQESPGSGNRTPPRRHQSSGTYISFEDAVRLCRFFNLSSGPIAQLTAGLSEPHVIDHGGDGYASNTGEERETVFPGLPSPWQHSSWKHTELALEPYDDSAENLTSYAQRTVAPEDGQGQGPVFQGSAGAWQQPQHSNWGNDKAGASAGEPMCGAGGTEATALPWSFHSDITVPTGTACVPPQQAADAYSHQYTESSGSYLAPAGRSYEQLRTMGA
ncbi:hypothetical protein VTK56DRAFT_8927 [Thermocarpiscus australiensis]